MRLPDYIKGPYWEPRDIWLGVFWDREWINWKFNEPSMRRTSVYICIVPCFPVRLTWIRLPAAQQQPGDAAP